VSVGMVCDVVFICLELGLMVSDAAFVVARIGMIMKARSPNKCATYNSALER
jgi:hypothetical protein